jgi:hypothetical protein
LLGVGVGVIATLTFHTVFLYQTVWRALKWNFGLTVIQTAVQKSKQPQSNWR